MPPSIASVVHTFEAVAGSWRSVRTPAVSRVMSGAPQRKNFVSLKYIGLIYLNVGEICFIPMNINVNVKYLYCSTQHRETAYVTWVSNRVAPL